MQFLGLPNKKPNYFKEKKTLLRHNFLVLFSLFALAPTVSAGTTISESIFSTVGNTKGIDPFLLYSVALAESAFQEKDHKTVKPYPFALRTHSRAFYGDNYESTVKELDRILKSTKSVDIGLMQINFRWHSHRVSKPEDLLNLYTNISIGADILKERLIANHGNWTQALAQYHSFDSHRGSWYAAFVLGIYAQICNDASENSKVLPW